LPSVRLLRFSRYCAQHVTRIVLSREVLQLLRLRLSPSCCALGDVTQIALIPLAHHTYTQADVVLRGRQSVLLASPSQLVERSSFMVVYLVRYHCSRPANCICLRQSYSFDHTRTRLQCRRWQASYDSIPRNNSRCTVCCRWYTWSTAKVKLGETFCCAECDYEYPQPRRHWNCGCQHLCASVALAHSWEVISVKLRPMENCMITEIIHWQWEHSGSS
jgi:hypothetical protein